MVVCDDSRQIEVLSFVVVHVSLYTTVVLAVGQCLVRRDMTPHLSLSPSKRKVSSTRYAINSASSRALKGHPLS